MGDGTSQARSRSPSAVCNWPIRVIVTISDMFLLQQSEDVARPSPDVDSLERAIDNNSIMPSLNVQNPGMPDLQFVLFVSALCTSNLETLNIPSELRRAIFDRCWALVNTTPPPTNPKERVLDLREGTELT